MTTTKSSARLQTVARVLLPLLVVATAVVQAQVPAQLPLLSKPGAAVAPNVMLTIDDSGSMQFQHMPETVFASDTFVTPNPLGGRTVRWDHNDNYRFGVNPLGQVPGIIGSTNWVLKALRSPDTNTIFYNPETLYQSWLTSDGVTRRGLSPANAAFKDPMNPVTGGVINLTATTAVAAFVPGTIAASAMVNGVNYAIVSLGNTNWNNFGAGNTPFVSQIFTKQGGAGSGTGTVLNPDTLWGRMPWCFQNDANTGNANGLAGDGCSFARDAFTHDPGVYFRLTKSGTGAYNPLTNSANYTAYSINTLGGTYPKVAARTDCSGAVGPTGCTQAQERQNYANWFSYYRTRNLLARGGLLEAFAVEATPVNSGSFVTGSSYAITFAGTTSFTTIGAANNTVDTVFTATGPGSDTDTGTARAIVMRLGFGRINQATAAEVDGVDSTTIENNAIYGGGGVRDFNRARKNNLFSWLENLPGAGGTPLVRALTANGEYYSRTDNQGPWTDNPAVNTNNTALNKTCRRSYTFLTTDGYWTTAGTAGNADNTAGTIIESVIVPPDTAPRYAPYTYAAGRPYADAWSNTLADTAMLYWKTDLQTSTDNLVPPVGNNVSFWQNMSVYTIGLGVRGTLNPAVDLPALVSGTKTWPQAQAGGTAANVDDLWHAAINSRGEYFSVKDPQELATAIRTALARTTGGTGSTAGVAAASNTLLGNNRKYKLEYDPGSWNGDITALGPNPVPPNRLDTPVWRASQRMPLYGARNVVTFDITASTWSGTLFNWASIPTAGRTALGTVAAANPDDFINYLKGDHTHENAPTSRYRKRINPAGAEFVLGDFVNANPALVWKNFDGKYDEVAWGGAAAYKTFMTAKAARTPVLFASSNDGMLHAFTDSLGANPGTDGREIFAYVPRAVYGNLEKLLNKNYGTTGALPHQYFVDGPLAEADAFVKGPGASASSWRNYLMGTLGAGGRAVFALDVTDTSNLNPTSVRWELSSAEDADIGHVVTNVRIGVLPNDRWVAVFGNGVGSTGGTLGASRAVLFVVDLEDAASSNAATRASAIHKTVLGTAGSNGLGGVTLIHDPVTKRIKTIYAGDLTGKLWKLNYNNPTGVPVAGSPWFDADGGAAFFTATDSLGAAQPITSSPAVFKGPNFNGYLVAFGTGKLFSTPDASDTSPQTVYTVWDKKAGLTPLPETVSRPMSRSNLHGRNLTAVAGSGTSTGTTFYTTSGTAVDYTSAKRGWFIDLTSTLPGGRVIYPTQVLGYDTVFFSAVAPVQGSPQACDSSFGLGLNLVLPTDSGTSPSSRTFDTNGDGSINATDVATSAYSAKADGGDVSVSSQGASGDNPLSDVGGGGPVGDCTGDACAKNRCVPSATCGSGKCLVVIESASGSINTCRKEFPIGTRVWRRIINPPIK